MCIQKHILYFNYQNELLYIIVEFSVKRTNYKGGGNNALGAVLKTYRIPNKNYWDTFTKCNSVSKCIRKWMYYEKTFYRWWDDNRRCLFVGN